MKWKLPISKRGLFFLVMTVMIILQVLAAIFKWAWDYVSY